MKIPIVQIACCMALVFIACGPRVEPTRELEQYGGPTRIESNMPAQTALEETKELAISGGNLSGGVALPFSGFLPAGSVNTQVIYGGGKGTNNLDGTAGDDLDCADMAESGFLVGPNDPYGFDADSDGIGCE